MARLPRLRLRRRLHRRRRRKDEASASFSPLQLDVFHALYEEYHDPDATPRPAGPPTRGARQVTSREHTLRLFPIGTPAGRELADGEGHLKAFKANLFDCCDPYWRVEYRDDGWEGLLEYFPSVMASSAFGYSFIPKAFCFCEREPHLSPLPPESVLE